MAWANANRAMKVHFYFSLWFSVEKQRILLCCCTEGWHHCICNRIFYNTIEGEPMTASYIRTENNG